MRVSKAFEQGHTMMVSPLKDITHGGGFIDLQMYIKLGILLLCTEPWHGTRSIRISWDFCLYWKAIWWIDYVYRILIVNTHSPFNYI